jgi:hypothetical protein
VASSRSSSPMVCIHCDATTDLILYRDRNENSVRLCRDGIACTRRAMAAQGIKLLPHPRNPEPLRGI